MNWFLRELRRRHVYRVAAAYAVVAWLLLQLASIVLPTFGAPGWVLKVLIALFVLFFPVALLLAWAFEGTHEGVRRTVPAQAREARTSGEYRRVGHYLNAVIIVVLAAAVGVLAWQLTARSSRVTRTVAVAPAAATAVSAPAATKIPAKSIAVLPFENLSGDKGNEYFVAGMQDLILTKLADIGDLKVIARSSTQQYASHPGNLTQVGKQLGVATILEGSVQKADNQVLINVQLIDTDSDSHIWAHSYTRTLNNIFGVEGEVAEKIAEALNTKLSASESARLASVPTHNPAALDLFLRAEFLTNQGLSTYLPSSWKAAIPLYRKAIEEDPNFALAYARLSFAEGLLAWFGGGGDNVKQLKQQARADADQALKLAPDSPASYIALAYSDYHGRGDFPDALKAFEKALALKPKDVKALTGLGYLQRRWGRFDDALVSLKKAFKLDPRNVVLAHEIANTYMYDSRYPRAKSWYRRALALDPNNPTTKLLYSSAILVSTGDAARALTEAQGDAAQLKLMRVLLLSFQRKYREALALLDSVPGTPNNFAGTYFAATLGAIGGSKALQQADLYQLLGEKAKARPLYQQALAQAHKQVSIQQGVFRGFAWRNIARAELGLGHTAEGLKAVARSKAIADDSPDLVYRAELMYFAAELYAEVDRPDLAVPLLAKALAAPGIGIYYSPVLLWLDPHWASIRHDPQFQALLQKYAKSKPADIPHRRH